MHNHIGSVYMLKQDRTKFMHFNRIEH
jgi:hypothetical protein